MADPLFLLLLLLRYMHILGAIMLMGGTIFMRFALAPTVGTLDDAAKSALQEQVRSRWSKFVMLASALLLISGLTNLALAGRYEYQPVFGMSYHLVVGLKFVLALPIFYIASMLAGRSAAAQRFRDSATMWMNINLLLALTMVLIGGALKFVSRELKSSAPVRAAVAVQEIEIASKTLFIRQAGE